MTKLTFTSDSNKSVLIDVPSRRENLNSRFVIGGHKTGSVLVTKIIKEINNKINIGAIPVESSVWSQGFSIPDWPEDLYKFLERDGYVFYSFRWLQKLPNLSNFDSSKKIFFIRDLRDVAVSYFYSMTKSHGIPKSGASKDSILKARKEAEGQDINEFLLEGKCNTILNNISKFYSYRNCPNSKIVKYEDFIYDKRKLVSILLEFLDAELETSDINEIADRNHIIPEKENVNTHIRNVHPGNFKEKLSPDAIAFIEKKYSDFMYFFQYLDRESS
jgi:hypothetical protein